jgi:hypothetical protein
MSETYKRTSTSGIIILFLALITGIALKSGYTENRNWYLVLLVTLPLILLSAIGGFRKEHSGAGNVPVASYLRYLSELIRFKKGKHLFQSDVDTKPFNGRQNCIFYPRSKSENETVASGMQAEANKSVSQTTKLQSHLN